MTEHPCRNTRHTKLRGRQHASTTYKEAAKHIQANCSLAGRTAREAHHICTSDSCSPSAWHAFRFSSPRLACTRAPKPELSVRRHRAGAAPAASGAWPAACFSSPRLACTRVPMPVLEMLVNIRPACARKEMTAVFKPVR